MISNPYQLHCTSIRVTGPGFQLSSERLQQRRSARCSSLRLKTCGHRVTDIKGQCFGVVVRSRGLGGNIMAGLRSIVGGEIDEYTQLLEEARAMRSTAWCGMPPRWAPTPC